jgi:hypothetical protein
MGRKRKHYPEARIMCVKENGEAVISIEFDGRRIAKRGHPDSPQARTWVSLEPGFNVYDGPGGVTSGS